MAFGRLPSELRASITHWDILKLVAYRDKYGPMNPVRMYDRGPAVIAALTARVNGNSTVKESDFLPYGHESVDPFEPEPD